MSCKKASAGSSNATADVSTSLGASAIDNIGVTYSEQVKRELVEVSAESQEPSVTLRAWCSGTNYQGKKGRYLFFINSEPRAPLLPSDLPETTDAHALRSAPPCPAPQTGSSTARHSSAPSKPSTATSSQRGRTPLSTSASTSTRPRSTPTSTRPRRRSASRTRPRSSSSCARSWLSGSRVRARAGATRSRCVRTPDTGRPGYP